MRRCIDADAFAKTINILSDKMDRSGQIVCEQISAILGCYEVEDVAPVRHGRWKRVGDTAWECSACGCISCCNGTYCPDCGASMMEGAEE